MQKTTSCCN